jgi:hypothetical protein
MKPQNKITVTHAIIAVAFFLLGEITSYLTFQYTIHEMCTPSDGISQVICVLDSKA